MRLRHPAATLVLAASALALTGVAGQARQSDPPGMSLSRAGLTAQGSLGTHCAESRCVDFVRPPEPDGRLPVKRRARVTLTFTRPADAVQARLGREQDGRRLRVERVSATVWTVRLPRRLSGEDVIDVFARGAAWDANFWGGIRAGCG